MATARRKKKQKETQEKPMSDDNTKKPFDPNDVAYCKIHPGIGIARVGDSLDGFFIGPETPGEMVHPVGGFKDEHGRIKRQAARFRVYAYNAAGEAIYELTANDADINWSVQLANKKASYRIILGRYWDIQYPDVKKYADEHFGGQPPMRNQEVSVNDPEQRSQLLDIRPEARTIGGRNEKGTKYELTGSFGPLKYTVASADVTIDGKDVSNQNVLLGTRSGFMNVPFVDPTQPDLTKQFQEAAKQYKWVPGVMQEPIAESGSAQVYLGELRTDAHGRLLVLGGRGESRSLIPDNDVGFLNNDDYFGSNDYWYDDVSDGVVGAEVTLKDGRRVEVKAKSWVLCVPPKFAPDFECLTTLKDQSDQVAQNKGQIPAQTEVSFKDDIYPILLRLNHYQWVNQFALQQHGNGMVFDPLSQGPGTANIFPKLHEKSGKDGGTDANAEMRMHVFKRMRKPIAVLQAEHPDMPFDELIVSPYADEQSGMAKMPQMWGDGGDGLDPVGKVLEDPTEQTNPGQGIPGGTYVTWATLTQRQYNAMRLWAEGKFVDDWPHGRSPLDAPKSLPTAKLPIKEQPVSLDNAAMLPCVGAPFFPGIELTYICENSDFWAELGRPDWRNMEPGDVIRHMALPWQADFSECNHRWWPVARPDDIVTEAQYEDVLRNYDPTLDGPLQAVLAGRTEWARGIPQVSPGLDNGMVAHWSEFGFIVPRTVHGDTVYVETDRDPYAGCSERDAFYYLMNIADYPAFEPHARLMVEQYLAQARQNASDPQTVNLFGMYGWNYFQYTPEAFDARMQDIYNQYVLANANASYLSNTTYEYQRYLQIQLAPFNQLDGTWIRQAGPPGTVDQVRNLLFQIYMDELGDAIVEHNHANVYTDTLHNLNFYPYDMQTRDYANDSRFLDSAFTEPVFLLAISNFTEDYLPEILGMTLYLEWSSVGLAITVATLESLGMDPSYYRLHVGIDNASAGHGALAKQAVELYLDQVRVQGGNVQEMFERIWTGYVAFGTLGTLNQDIQAQFTQPESLLNRMIDMINSKAQYARQNHGNKKLGPNFMNDWFDDPAGLLDELVASGFIVPGYPEKSPFFQLTSFTGPMFHVFTPEELKLWENYIVSLDPPAKRPELNLEAAMLYVIDKLRQRQSGTPGHHARLTGVDPRNNQTVTMPIAWWFEEQFGDKPNINDYTVLRALRNPVNGWITPGNSGTSPLLTQLLAGIGDMAEAFRAYVPDHLLVPTPDKQIVQPFTYKQVLAMWVDDGCRVEGVVDTSLTTQKQAAAKGRLAIRDKEKPGAPVTEVPAAPQLPKWVRPHRVYGMGVPH